MGKAKIVIIDDDPDLVESMRIVLEADQYEVHFAHNGPDGLQLVKKVHPSLIILDVMMNSITEGFQVSRELRSPDPQSEYRDCAGIPILMLTGISQKMNMQFSPKTDGDYLPVDAFVEKPIQLEALLDKVKQMIKP